MVTAYAAEKDNNCIVVGGVEEEIDEWSWSLQVQWRLQTIVYKAKGSKWFVVS